MKEKLTALKVELDRAKPDAVLPVPVPELLALFALAEVADAKVTRDAADRFLQVLENREELNQHQRRSINRLIEMRTLALAQLRQISLKSQQAMEQDDVAHLATAFRALENGGIG